MSDTKAMLRQQVVWWAEESECNHAHSSTSLLTANMMTRGLDSARNHIFAVVVCLLALLRVGNWRRIAVV